MNYDVFLTERAEKDLQKMDSSNEERIRKKIKKLSNSPERYGKPLKGPEPLWSMKVGKSDWRVIYKIKEEKVLVITIGHRRNIYDRFP